ncbi:sensor histidine kinase [Blastopirellula marina]|uniref:histidine kinase n=1 Tax=Blastopirellula marina TaxID=124 RepID=A0A2S8G9C9_9BACT|nr:HAMP domain-containing sensor histidine kinase [Blastopirellula marina]PQO41029.1 two-component sensor histidine kinase [Blastopirellula marina]PTL45905.1 sensor histidine kinase [Blastopirellula marina]
MKTLSIRWRLTLWYGMTLAVALGSFCLLILVLESHQSLNHIDTSLQEELAERVLEVQLARSMPELDTQLRTRFYHHDDYDFRVFDGTGKSVFVSAGLIDQANMLPDRTLLDSAVPSSTSPSFETFAIGQRGDYRVASAWTEGGLGKFLVQTMVPMQPYYAEIRSLQSIMLVMLPLVLAAASVGGYALAGRALAPVSQIGKVASAITIDCLDRRIEIVNPNDEIGRLAAILNSLIARLERAVIEIQRFTADASHELRTPLAALRSEVELALQTRRSPEEYEQALTIVLDEATRLGRMADQLLSLSRYDAGLHGNELESIRLDALLFDVADQLRPLAVKRNVTMECGDVQPCEMQGDVIRLSQAFSNIMENALKYTPEHGRVDIHCRVVNDVAVIEVQDTGIGIATEHLPHVFDRFYRADASRSTAVGGTGLGLSIAQSAVGAHGGVIHLSGMPDCGTLATIRLPGVTPASDDLEIGPSLSAFRSSNRDDEVNE